MKTGVVCEVQYKHGNFKYMQLNSLGTDLLSEHMQTCGICMYMKQGL